MAHRTQQPDKEAGQRGNEKLISLAPLEFEEALRGLLQVPPEKVKDKELDQPKKRTSKRRAK